jgi:hypothetical protein
MPPAFGPGIPVDSTTVVTLGARQRAVEAGWLASVVTSSPLANRLAPRVEYLLMLSDDNQALRGMAPVVLALRHWQAEHDGKLPERLEELVPRYLDRLPDDPYRNGLTGGSGTFGYVAREFDRFTPMDWFALGQSPVSSRPAPIEADWLRQGVRLLYSIGPDRHDSGGNVASDGLRSPGDLVVLLRDNVPPPDPAPAR